MCPPTLFNTGDPFVPRQAHLEHLNILVVNANTNMTRLLRTVLKAYGMGRVDEARNLQEARTLFQLSGYDIIVTDVHVGHERGFDLVQWLRGDDGRGVGPFTPVIVASAASELRTVMMSVTSGADEFVTLPLSPRTLFRRIEKLIFKPHSYIRAPGYFGPCRRRRVDENYAGPERRGVHRDQTAA